jgi:hypothetical protein
MQKSHALIISIHSYRSILSKLVEELTPLQVYVLDELTRLFGERANITIMGRESEDGPYEDTEYGISVNIANSNVSIEEFTALTKRVVTEDPSVLTEVFPYYGNRKHNFYFPKTRNIENTIRAEIEAQGNTDTKLMPYATTETIQPNTHFEVKCAPNVATFIKVDVLVEADSVSFSEEGGDYLMKIHHTLMSEHQSEYKLANKRELFRVKRAVKDLLKAT